MRIPNQPPSSPEIIQSIMAQGRWEEFMKFGNEESQRAGHYLHWDDFRHRVARSAGELTLEERWAALRMNRSMRAQPVPLRDIRGSAFTFFLTQSAFESLHAIAMDCGGSMSVAEEGLIQEDTRDRYYISSVFEEALTSSQLEGAVVTRSEAREIIRNSRPPATGHERMVVNNYRTMRLVSELKDQDLTPELILRIHREITAGTLEKPGDEGRFRDLADDVRVEDEESGEIIHYPPPAHQLSNRIAELCLFANDRGMGGFLHPVVRSIILHFWIAYDHPFIDGNGRTARALFYWSMLRHGFWLAEFFSISSEILKAPKKYYRAFLHTETDGNDLNYFILHQLGVIQSSIVALKAYIHRKRSELEDVRKFLGPGAGFNHRQLALLRHAMKHPYATYTVAGHQSSHGVVYQTAMTDLATLETRGLLKRGKIGKSFIYSPVGDLLERVGRGERG